MNACKLKWCDEKGTYVADDGEEGNTVDDEWFDGEDTLDLDVKVEYVEEMVLKGEDEWGSEDELDPFDEGDEFVILEGGSAEPPPPRSRQQNPNLCHISGHSTYRDRRGQYRSVPCGLTPQPAPRTG